MLRTLARTPALYRGISSAMTSDTTGPVGRLIKERITAELNPQVLVIKNDSHKHAHHAAMRGSDNITESHFRMTIVTDKFQGLNQPARHRLVYGMFKDEMAQENGIHAMQLSTKTPEEWEKLQKN